PRKDGLNPESLTALIPQPLAHSSRRRREQPYKIVKLPSCDVSIRITYTDPLAHSSRRRREQPYKIVKLPSCDVSIRITYTDLSKTFRGCVTAVRTLRYGCRKVKIGSVPVAVVTVGVPRWNCPKVAIALIALFTGYELPWTEKPLFKLTREEEVVGCWYVRAKIG
ncbi:hypothetical protein HAX54_014785, partial [Datura stramonium]|nr:hypothetical protein [Datura stramonium]